MAKNNQTKLRNSYMYGHEHRKNNYFNKFKTVKNDNRIDDPIYTGFTLSIDMNSSPLFYSDYADNPDIANAIGEKLSNIWKNIKSNGSYVVQSHSVKPSFDNGNKIGYGLQENVFMDELLYGAVDYIYMVDKIDSGTQYTSPDNLGSLTNQTTMDNGVDTESDEMSELDKLNAQIDSKEKDLQDAQNTLSNMNNGTSNDGENNKSDEEDVQKIIKAYHEYQDKLSALSDKLANQMNLVQRYKNELLSLQGDAVDDFKNNKGKNVASYTEELNNLINRGSAAGIVFTNDPNITTKEQAAAIWGDKKNDAKYFNTDEKIKIVATMVSGDDSIEDVQKELDDFLNDPKSKPDGYSETINTADGPIPVPEYERMQKNTPSSEAKQQETVDRLSQELDELKEERDNLDFWENADEVDPETGEYISKNNTKDADVDATQNGVNQQATDNLYQRDNGKASQSVLDMIGFIQDMDEITTEFPYMLLSVNGLDNAYKKYFGVKDSYLGSGDDTISIDCLESLDMKMSAMFNKYFNAVYDRQWRRERVPINLRRFNCSIFVHDIRNFREVLSRIKNNADYNPDGDNTSSLILELALNYLSVVEFKFFDCEIIPEETGNIFGNISDEDKGEPIRTTFTFKYGNCVINFLPFEMLANNYNGGLSKKEVAQGGGSTDYVKNDSVKSEEMDDERSQHMQNRTKFMNSDAYKNLKPDTEGTQFKKGDVVDYLGDIKEFNGRHNYKGVSEEELADLYGTAYGVDYRRYWDSSVLGNVSNDDYLDYIRRDHPTAVNDFIRNQYSDMFANNSVGQIQEASTQLDNILHRTVLGISASIGEPPTTVADVLGVGYLNNAFHGETPKEKTTELGNVFGPSDAINNTGHIQGGNDQNTNSTGTTNTLGQENWNTETTGSSNELGNTGSGDPSKGMSNKLGVTDGKPESTGTTDGIEGDMANQPDSVGTSNNLGDLIPDTDASGTTDKLGSTGRYDGDVTGVSDIGNVEVTKESTGISDDLGKFDLSAPATGTTDKLGSTGRYDGSPDTNTEIGNVQVTGKSVGISSDLGKFNLDAPATGTTDKLGTTDNKFNGSSSTSPDLGSVDVSVDKVNETYSDLGHYDLSGKPIGTSSDLGKFDLSGNSTGINKDLGKFDLEKKSTGISSDLGNFNVKYPSSGETKDLGKYNLESKSIGTNEDLGKFNLDAPATGTTSDLGGTDVKGEEVGINSELGSMVTKGEVKGETKDLGNQPTSSPTPDDNFRNLGNVFRD